MHNRSSKLITTAMHYMWNCSPEILRTSGVSFKLISFHLSGELELIFLLFLRENQVTLFAVNGAIVMLECTDLSVMTSCG